MAKRFTAEEILALSANPNVKNVRSNRLTLTFEFRTELYNAWALNPGVRVLREMFENNGFDAKMIPNEYLHGISEVFRRCGAPSSGKNRVKRNALKIDQENTNYLLDTGKFVRKYRGIQLEPSFREKLRQAYPDQSIEDGLRSAGIDPERVGYDRIRRIKRSFEKEVSSVHFGRKAENDDGSGDIRKSDREQSNVLTDSMPVEIIPDAVNPANSAVEKEAFFGHNNDSADSAENKETSQPFSTGSAGSSSERERGCSGGLADYTGNPYVELSGGIPRMSEAFYNEASDLLFLSMEEIFSIYGIHAEDLTEQYLSQVHRDLLSWKKTEVQVSVISPEMCRIQKARMEAVEGLIRKNFEETRAMLPGLSLSKKKELCQEIDACPTAPEYGFRKKYIISQCGFSKAQFYKILRSDAYGLQEELKEKQDEKDVELIRKVLAYNGFRKGARQVYMQLPRLTGAHFALSKVRRLMQKYHLQSDIRKAKNQKKAARERRDQFEKPNLLRRRFRMHRPLEVRLTDVTYLDYGYNPETKKPFRAYGSSALDPVTGKSLVLNLSRNNDLPLAMETLVKLSEYPVLENALLHSDRGVLYLTDEFQKKVLDLKMDQSMSRLGNCWDNAPQESYFALFKTESGYENCTSFDELEDIANRYRKYFNEERPKWDRMQMTPNEYEEYLNGLSDEEFAEYLAKEEKIYQEKRKEAREKAIEKAKRESGQLSPEKNSS